MIPKKQNPKSLANLQPPWKPGQSGNPKGMAKGTKTIVTVLREILEKEGRFEDSLSEHREKKTMTVRNAIAHQIIATALKDPGALSKHNQLKAADMILDRVHGKPKQVIETIDIPVSNDEASDRLARIAADEGMSLEDFCDREGIEVDVKEDIQFQDETS